MISLIIGSAIARCLLVNFAGTFISHARKSVISIAESSAMFLSAMRKLNASRLSR